jgi:hypothetical protein
MGWSSSKNIYRQNRKENISGETRWRKKSRKTKINVARLYLERSEIDALREKEEETEDRSAWAVVLREALVTP